MRIEGLGGRGTQIMNDYAPKVLRLSGLEVWRNDRVHVAK